MAAAGSEGSLRPDGDIPSRPGTEVKASRRALSARLGKMKEFSHLTGRHLQGTVTKADIAAVQRAADAPGSRRRLSAMAHNLTDDAMRGGGLTMTPARSVSAPKPRPEQRDMSKGQSAVYSRELLHARAKARSEVGPQTPGPNVPVSSDFGAKTGTDPLFLDPGRRKSRGTTPVTKPKGPAPKSALRGGKQYLADSKRGADDASAAPSRPGAITTSAGRRRGSSGPRGSLGTGSRGSGRALVEAESPAVGKRPHHPMGGEVLVKTSSGGCCAVM